MTYWNLSTRLNGKYLPPELSNQILISRWSSTPLTPWKRAQCNRFSHPKLLALSSSSPLEHFPPERGGGGGVPWKKKKKKSQSHLDTKKSIQSRDLRPARGTSNQNKSKSVQQTSLTASMLIRSIFFPLKMFRVLSSALFPYKRLKTSILKKRKVFLHSQQVAVSIWYFFSIFTRRVIRR